IKQCRTSLIDTLGKRDAPVLPSAGVLLSMYSNSVNCMVDLEDAVVRQNRRFLGVFEHIEEIWKRYVQAKLDQNSLDYDDLLLKAVELFTNNPDALQRESERFRWILCDEFQDTNLLQYRLLELLAKCHGNLIVVGDDAQSIYSFRGARFENVYDFLNKKETKVFRIQTNYRSTPEVVKLTNAIFPENSIEKELVAVRSSGPIPVVADTWDVLEEAAFVAQKIEEHVNDGISPERIGVLYRSHAHSMDLQLELDKRQISYIVFSGPRFVESAHVKDLLAFLRITQNPYEQLSWSRILRLFPGVGASTAMKVTGAIRAGLGDGASPADIVRNFTSKRIRLEPLVNTLKAIESVKSPRTLVETVYNVFYNNYLDNAYQDAYNRRMDVERLMEIADRYNSINAMLEDILISEKVDMEREQTERREKVVLSTVHQAKGLEWDVVFVLSVNPGDFPSSLAIMEGNLDEEERIFYVAVTRAKDYLYIMRQRGGRNRPVLGNRYVFRSGHDFISRINQDLAEHWDVSWG
ncbi:MAG TPA: ATP-dependent helicase, partial [Kosmotogaceae bacterium]|nr:ATP-dependent helicase [Kosmotogaceae bacterium]